MEKRSEFAFQSIEPFHRRVLSFPGSAWKKTAGIQLISYNIMPGCTTVSKWFSGFTYYSQEISSISRSLANCFYGMVKFLYYRISSVVLPVRAVRQEVKKAMVAFLYKSDSCGSMQDCFLCAVKYSAGDPGRRGCNPMGRIHMGIQASPASALWGLKVQYPGGTVYPHHLHCLGEDPSGSCYPVQCCSYMVDFLKWLNWVPAALMPLRGCGMMVLSLFVLAMGSFRLYRSRHGLRTRDSMSCLLKQRLTKVPVG